MQIKRILSICIPCFKRVEYLRNTLNSIYKDNTDVPFEEYEVIVSDNDKEKELSCLEREYGQSNFHYIPTSCEGFMNSFYVLTYGKGEYLLLHNSQELFKKGALRYLINLLKANQRKYFFFSSGFLLKGNIRCYGNFDNFMNDVSYWSSWSNGFGIWKADFDKIKETTKLNALFPHTSLLLTQYQHIAYIICDVPLFETQFVKGRSGHNKFHAFSYEYPSLINSVYRKGLITKKTYDKILHDILYDYLPLLYFNVKIAKRESWSSDGFNQDIKFFFPKGSLAIVKILSIVAPLKVFYRKLKRSFSLKMK